MYYKKLIKLLAICLIFWTFVAIFQQITYARKHIIINQTTATIQGQVWLDENEDGIRDVGETTLENIMVKLYDLESRTQRTTVTNDNGLFMFSSLPTDDYQIEFIAPIGYAFTALDRGEDDTIDSDVDPATGKAVIRLDGDINFDVGLRLSAPTPIALSYFEIGLIEQGAGVALQWETSAELQTQGFRLWRSTTAYRTDAVEITGGIIQSKSQTAPTEGPPYQYLFEDESIIDLNIFYSYWLQEIEDNNSTVDYGPRHIGDIEAVNIVPSVPIEYQGNRVYLPVIVR